MKILGIGHRRRMGKDALARFIIAHLRESTKYKGQNVTRRGFADPLYDTCYLLYAWAGFKRRIYYDDNPIAKESILPLLGRSPRQILIDVGNDLRRSDDYVWLSACTKGDSAMVLVVPDLRYPNEFKAIQEMGGKCIKIVRPGIVESDDVADSALANETGWDLIVKNDGNLQDLYLKAKEVVDLYL